MGCFRIVGLAVSGFIVLMALVTGARIALVLAVAIVLLLLPWPFLFTGNRHGEKQVRSDRVVLRKWMGAIAILLIPIALVVVGAEYGNTPEGKASLLRGERERRTKAAMEEARERAKTVEERRSGLHCLGSWDGSYRPLVESVQSAMRNPDSFEHAETRITPPDAEGNHGVIMTFRAENGFGGMNIEKAYAKARSEDCSMVSAELAN